MRRMRGTHEPERDSYFPVGHLGDDAARVLR